MTDPVNLILALVVSVMAVGAAMTPPAVAAELLIGVYVSFRALLRRLP